MVAASAGVPEPESTDREADRIESLLRERLVGVLDHWQTAESRFPTIRALDADLRAELAESPADAGEPTCSTCDGTGLVPWLPFQQWDSEDAEQPCPDCRRCRCASDESCALCRPGAGESQALPPDTERLADLIDRMKDAEKRLDNMADAALATDRESTRLAAKADGVRLARSYAEEAVRAAAASGGAEPATELLYAHQTDKAPHGAASSFWCPACIQAGIWPSNFDALFPRPAPVPATDREAREALLDRIFDAMTDNDVGCGPWCNSHRAACIKIRKDALRVVADVLGTAAVPSPSVTEEQP